MRQIISLLLTATLTSAGAQQISRSLDAHKSPAADLVLFAFGSDNPVKTGTFDANGINLENGIAELSYEYDLELKKGFNRVEYSIEDIHVTDPEIMASFPSKVRISNMSHQDKMKWMAEYLF
jgi:hypothetical protein